MEIFNARKIWWIRDPCISIICDAQGRGDDSDNIHDNKVTNSGNPVKGII